MYDALIAFAALGVIGVFLVAIQINRLRNTLIRIASTQLAVQEIRDEKLTNMANKT